LSDEWEEEIRAARSIEDLRNLEFNLQSSKLPALLATGVFNIHLVGRSQIWTDVLRAQPAAGVLAAVVLEHDFEPLPFDEAIEYFRRKLNLTPEQFERLRAAARAKAFTIADGASAQVRLSINELLEGALSDGLTLREFQSQAADVLDSAGVSARTPWYWETVYRTNLQTSYQVGRWQQMTDPYVAERRPYLRYVSALLPTSRPSHREKHGHIFALDHAFWRRWYPPNGFNCFCTAVSVSDAELKRNHWTVEEVESWVYPEPDEGFERNAGADATI